MAARENLSGLELELRGLVAEPSQILAGLPERRRYGVDLSLYRSDPPAAVVRPRTTAEVSEIVRFADREGLAVVACGARTSLEGQVLPVRGGIVLDMGLMDEILAIDPADLTATVQPGVMRSRLERALADYGLWFPVGPGADASLGGMVATNASGTTTIRYGDMRSQVRELELVLARGEIVRVGARTAKTSAGYRLVDLVVGSEGTLALVTEATVRVHPRPPAGATAMVAFPSVRAVCETVAELVGAGAQLLRAELMDAPTVRAVNRHCGPLLPESDLLLLDFGGRQASVKEELRLARETTSHRGAVSFVVEEADEGRERIWWARHQAAYAVMASEAGRRMRSTDTCVPLSAMPDAVAQARQVLSEAGVAGAIAGHVGDGNYHVAFGVDVDDPTELACAERITASIVAHALAVGGTCSAEHGIGLGKIDYLEWEHAEVIPLMKGVKELLDPAGLLNPGKVLR